MVIVSGHDDYESSLCVTVLLSSRCCCYHLLRCIGENSIGRPGRAKNTAAVLRTPHELQVGGQVVESWNADE